MSDVPELECLNSIKYLYLQELSEPRDNSLRIVVEEAVANRSAQMPVQPKLPEIAEIHRNAWPIESIAGCRTFELAWQSYVACLVTEECVGSCGESSGEVYTGKLFRVYTKSHFLDHLARATGAHIKPIQHYKLICLNHLIDVASYAPPEIRQIAPISPRLPTIQ
jgi:hypothetical protein